MKTQIFPEPIVGAIIVNEKGSILLLESHKWKDVYSIPGGHVELGETLREALVREVKEETGLDIFDIVFIGLQESIFDTQYFTKRHFIFFDFVCKTKGYDVSLNNEAQNYLWVTIDDAFDKPLVSNTRKTLENYITKMK